MNVERELESLLASARAALDGLNAVDRSVEGLVERVGALRYTEGTLVGFLDALVLTDHRAAWIAAPEIEKFVGEAIAARILLD